jgi:hypothetical protein
VPDPFGFLIRISFCLGIAILQRFVDAIMLIFSLFRQHAVFVAHHDQLDRYQCRNAHPLDCTVLLAASRKADE